MEDKCWICGNIANSNEHKFKASAIKSMFGKQFSVPLVYKSGEKAIKLQGPNSQLLKFSRSICRVCNNEFTQEHDKAFDVLISKVLNQYEFIEKHFPFKVENFYYENWEQNYLNLFKYFAKIIGCRLQENGFSEKTEKLSKFIKGEIENTFVSLNFEAKEGIKLWLQATKTAECSQTIFNGETCQYITDEGEEYFHGWVSLNWFTVHWLYSVDSHFDKDKIFSSNNWVKLIPFSVEGRNENIHPLDWFESSHFSTERLRKEYIIRLINEYK